MIEMLRKKKSRLNILHLAVLLSLFFFTLASSKSLVDS